MVDASEVVVMDISAFHGLGRPSHGSEDALIAGTATHVALDPVADLGVRRRGVAGEQVGRRHDHAGRAEPALQRVVVTERLLHRMELSVAGQPLDGGYFTSVGLNREH